MPSSRVSALTRNDITATAGIFFWTRQMPKWSVIIDGRELPARPLILSAAGVPPNDPTNSHQAVAILKAHGFEVRYEGRIVSEAETPPSPKSQNPTPQTDEEFEALLARLRGRFAGGPSLVDEREREHRIEKDRWPR